MAKPFLIKKGEIIPKGFNYANRLPSGAVIESITVEAINLDDQSDVLDQVMVGGSNLYSGNVVQARFKWVSGLAGKRVLLRFVTGLDSGAKLVEEQIMEMKSFPT